MSLAHQEPRAESAPRTLLRRLMIRCPATGAAADTGFEVTGLPMISRWRQVLVDCLECGQDHEWDVDQVFLE